MAKKKKRLAEVEELNLIPIMNLVTILIPFMLMSVQFINFAVIDSTLPAIGPPQPSEEKPDEPPLNLSVAITGEGYTVSGNGIDGIVYPDGKPEGEEIGPTIPCKDQGCPTPEAYDTKELTKMLNLIKDDYEDEENVILVPGSRVLYEVLVRTMDATREDIENLDGDKARELFPFVVIAGGAQ